MTALNNLQICFEQLYGVLGMQIYDITIRTKSASMLND